MTTKILLFVSILILSSCSNSENENEFDKMKEDLEGAAKAYCECMAKADTTSGHETEVCQKILHEEMIDKCRDNEIAMDFIHDEISKCVRERRGDEE